MIRKFCLISSLILYNLYSFSQNQQILFGFDQLPQNLMLNPGAEVNYEKHLGVPFLSNVYFQIGVTNKNISYNRIISGTNSTSESLRKVYEQNLDKSDYFSLNQRLEIIYAGFRLRNPKYYLSFGMYEEMDGYGLYPKELLELFYEGDDKNGDGIPEFNKVTNFNEIDFIGELIGVFHVGVSAKINDRLNIGARLKFLSGSLNLSSSNNSGNYQLNFSNSGLQHSFSNLNVLLNTSGFINSNGESQSRGFSDNVKGLIFLDGNVGLGLDLGITYHYSDKITFTGSVLDLGYINYSKNVTSYLFSNDFVIEDGAFFDPPIGDESGYWKDKFDEHSNLDQIPIDTLQVGFNSYRSPKINLATKYTFNQKKKGDASVFTNVKCDNCLSDDAPYLTSEVGIQSYTVFRPNKIGWALTAYYSRELTSYLNTKVTYTYDAFSIKNIGFGVSTHYRKFNFYITADNLLNLPKLKNSNYQSFQFGMNFIFP